MTMLHVLFVCTGNTCRSPMAMAIYEQKSREYGISSIFSSAALGFISNSGVSRNAQLVWRRARSVWLRPCDLPQVQEIHRGINR